MHHGLGMILSYVLLGAFAGMMAGMLGVGGGIIIVPGLVTLFQWQHFPDALIAHMAVGTSLAVMVATTWRALLVHRHYDIAFLKDFRYLLPGLVMGSIVGALLSHVLHSQVITLLFGLLMCLLGIYMLVAHRIAMTGRLPGRAGMVIAGGFIGGFSGLLGIGGGTITIPLFTYCRVELRQVIVLATGAGAIASILGCLMMMGVGLSATAELPWATGYVYWPACLSIILSGVGVVPWGVACSYRLPIKVLRTFFSVFIILVGIRLLYR